MRARLTIFVGTLLVLPPLALSLAGQEWSAPAPIAGPLWGPAMLSMLATVTLAVLLDSLTFLRGGHSLLRSQRSYLAWCSVAGAALGLLLAYLNLFTASWFTPAAPVAGALPLSAAGGALLLPTVLITRLWLAGLPGVVRFMTRKPALPSMGSEAAAILLLLTALAGLLGGPVWIAQLGWLFWLSPLLLLAALQLLWGESTVFSGLGQGDWSRLLLGGLAGIGVGSIALAAYRLSGGALYIEAERWKVVVALAVFGILCVQLADIVAENWRGKKTAPPSFGKKPFPIPVVSRKDQ